MNPVGLFGVLLVLFVQQSQASWIQWKGAAPPSYGDIALGNDSLVGLYLGPDGSTHENMWGTLNGYNASTKTDVANTLCRQLGRDGGSMTVKEPNLGVQKVPVWLSGIRCPPNANHIMRCHSSRTDFLNPDTNHESDIHLKCSDKAYSDPANAYVGQVVLFPPDSNQQTRDFSASYGMVAIRAYNSFVLVKEDNPLTPEEGDTLCRTMQFTNAVANSVMTARRSQFIYGYQYNSTKQKITTAISSKDISCLVSTQCLRCCLDHDGSEILFHPSSTLLSLNSQSGADILTIRCTFYNSSAIPAPGGYKDICIANSTKSCSSLSSESGTSTICLPRGTFIVSIVAPTGTLLLIIPVIIGFAVFYVIKKTTPPRNYENVPNGQ